MARTGFLAALVLGCFFYLPAAARANDYQAQKAQILTAETTIAMAQSVPELKKYYDPNVVLDDFTPGRVRGHDNVMKDFAVQFAAVKNIHVTILQMSIDADDELAFAYSMQKLSLTIVKTGQQAAFTFRQSDDYHRVNGKWLLVYQTFSLPYDPKTGKVVFNAPP